VRHAARSFVARLWEDLLAAGPPEASVWMDTAAYQVMLAQIRMRGNVPLVPIPWDSPYLLVDLAEDFNAELLRAFFDTLVLGLRARAPGAAGRGGGGGGGGSGGGSSATLGGPGGLTDEETADKLYAEWLKLLALENTEPNSTLELFQQVRARSSSGLGRALLPPTPMPASGTPAAKVTHVVLGLLAPPVLDEDAPVYLGGSDSPPLSPTADRATGAAAGSWAAADPAATLAAATGGRFPELTVDSSRVAGGIVLDYFPTNNVGLITHLALADASHDRLGNELLARAIEILTVRAHEYGYFGGCDAIFMEAKRDAADDDDDDDGDTEDDDDDDDDDAHGSAGAGRAALGAAASPSRRPVDLTATHEVLYQHGWSLLDLAYEPPPHGLASWTAALVWARSSASGAARAGAAADAEGSRPSSTTLGDLAALERARASVTSPPPLPAPPPPLHLLPLPTTASNASAGGGGGSSNKTADAPAAERPPTATWLYGAADRAEVDVLLLVRLSETIPCEVHAEQKLRYLPRATVLRFIESHWRACEGAAATAAAPLPHTQLVPYRRMVDQVRRREQVPIIVDLPWDTPSLVISLRDDFEPELLEQFLRRFAYTPGVHALAADELTGGLALAEATEAWRRTLDNDDAPVHLLLAVRYHQQTAQPLVEGGLVARYLPSINCGLVSALRLTRTGQQQQLASVLLEAGQERLAVEATAAGHIAGCQAIFVEAVLPTLLDDATPPARPALPTTAAATTATASTGLAPPAPPKAPVAAKPAAAAPVTVRASPGLAPAATAAGPASSLRLLSRLPSAGPGPTSPVAAAAGGIQRLQSPPPPAPAAAHATAAAAPPSGGGKATDGTSATARRTRTAAGAGGMATVDLLAPPGLAHTHPLLQFLDMPYVPGCLLGVYRTDWIPVRVQALKPAGAAGDDAPLAVSEEVPYLPSPLVTKLVAVRRQLAHAPTLPLGLAPVAADAGTLERIRQQLADRDSVDLRPLMMLASASLFQTR